MSVKEKSNTFIRKVTVILFFLFTVLAACFLFLVNDDCGITINEICIHNTSVVHDSKGNYFDYVELYNDNNYEFDLSDYYLSDDSEDLKKFSLKGTVIAAKSYKGIFIDKEVCGFALSDDETLYFSNSKNVVCDAVKYGKTGENESISLNRETGRFEVSTPSFEKENIPAEYYSYNIEKPVSDSVDGNYDTPFYLSLSSDYEIYYTLDGSVPNSESAHYTQPIYIYDRSDEENIYGKLEEITMSGTVFFNENPVCKGTVIRAVAIDENGVTSEEYIGTFFVGLNNKSGYNQLPTISMVTDPDDFFGYENGIYVKGSLYDINYSGTETDETSYMANYRKRGKGWKRSVNLEVFDVNGEIIESGKATAGIHGVWSRNFAQKSFNVSLNDEMSFLSEYGNSYNSFVFKATGSADEYETIGSRIRGTMIQEIAQDLNVLTQPGNFFQLFLNGEYWGVYYLQPKIDEKYIASYTDVPTENIEFIKNWTKYTSIDDEGIDTFTKILYLSEEWDFAVDSDYEEFCRFIDIESLIDYYSIEFYINNTDWPSNNYAVYRNSSKEKDSDIYGGKFKWYLNDCDDSSGYRTTNDYLVDPFIRNSQNTRYQLFLRLMCNKKFRDDFLERFYMISEEIFDYDRISQIVKQRFSVYKDSFVESQKRFFDENYSGDDFDLEVDKFLEYYKFRGRYATYYADVAAGNFE